MSKNSENSNDPRVPVRLRAVRFGAGSDKAPTTVDEVARLLSDVATLAKMDQTLRERVEAMLRDLTRGRR